MSVDIAREFKLNLESFVLPFFRLHWPFNLDISSDRALNENANTVMAGYYFPMGKTFLKPNMQHSAETLVKTNVPACIPKSIDQNSLEVRLYTAISRNDFLFKCILRTKNS